MLGLYTAAQGLLSKSGLIQAVRRASYLGHLAPLAGATKTEMRVGRGPASGKGKTSGRGQKGQKARGKVPHWLEGGQTPYYKRFPITGFKRPHRKDFNKLTLAKIQDFWDHGRIPLKAGETLTIKAMHECGLITGPSKDGVQLLALASDKYNVPLNIEASKATARAMETVENLGNKYTSVYHTKLGLEAHIDPDRFLLKKGHVPLQARPTHKRDIAFYSNPEKRGYLLEDTSILLDHVGSKRVVKKTTTQSALSKLMENASTKAYGEYSSTGIVDLASLK